MKFYIDDNGGRTPLLKSYGNSGFKPADLGELDQVVRELTGPAYAEWVRAQCEGEDGPDAFCWDEGIAP